MRNPFACRLMRGRIAAAVYDDLDAPQRHALDTHLASCEHCRAEFDQLKRVAQAIPVGRLELGRDLAPVLLARIAEKQAPTRRLVPNLAWAGTAAVIVAGLYVAWPMLPQSEAPAPTINVAVAPESNLAPLVAEATQLADQRDYMGAYEHLKNAVTAYPEDPLAGPAQIRLADLAFSELHWYDRAYSDYEALVKHYPSAVESSTDRNLIRDRRDLLAEARQFNYASLDELDAARNAGPDGFGRMEGVIAKYPGMLVASLAAHSMAELAVTDNDEDGPATRLQALETARGRSADPVAVAQLTMEIGHIHRNELGDPDGARQFYRQVAEGQNVVLAKAAQDLLVSLESQPAQ